MIHGQKNIKLK